jgi:glycosyltransferase involved in cell wall biosynthesis
MSAGIAAEASGKLYPGFSEVLESDGTRMLKAYYLPAVDLPILNRIMGIVSESCWLLQHRKCDVAIVYNLGPGQLVGAEELRRAGVPVVYEYEDDATATLERGAGGNPSGKLFVWAARRTACGVLAVNPLLKAQLGHANAEVIEGIVEDSRFECSTRDYDGSEALRILYSGGLTSAKGIDLLIEAVKRLKESYILTITGSGPLAREVRAAASTNAMVRFLGEVDRLRLRKELERCHVSVNPHRTEKGQGATLFPFKVAEYLASGSVVVSSPLCSLPAEMREGIRIYSGDSPAAISSALSAVARDYYSCLRGVVRARRHIRERLSMSAVGARVEAVLERAMRTK